MGIIIISILELNLIEYSDNLMIIELYASLIESGLWKLSLIRLLKFILELHQVFQ